MLRELIVKDSAWKLLSLGLAIAIWLNFRSDSAIQTDERIFGDLPAQIVSGTTDVRTFRVHPRVVQVTVKGRPDIIRSLAEQDLRVFVDGSTADPTRNFRQRVEVSTPTRITIVKIEPAEVEVVVPPRPASAPPQSQP